jgi:hypothetical protein
MKNNDTNASDPSNIANGSKTQSGKLPLLIAAIIKTNRTVVRGRGMSKELGYE